MKTVDKARRLKAMLTQIAPQNKLEYIQIPPRKEASLEGLESPFDPGQTVESGMQKLADGRFESVTPQEAFALEAIVMRENRPAVFVRGQSYDDVPDPWQSLNSSVVKTRIASLFPLIGRIELPLSSLVPYGGTGFVVGKGLLMTNRHVAQLFSSGLGLRIRYQPGGSAINFHRQVDNSDDDRSAYLNVVGVQMIHPYWDMALLKVDGLPTDAALTLSTTSPENLVGSNIVAVGYPAKDYRNDLALQDQIFGGKYNVKRLQPGTIRTRAEIASFENKVNAMTHDASTLGGNSGSAIVDVDTGEVVALHFAGEYLKANYAVPMFELARDRRVAPLLNFEGTLAPTNNWEPAWQRTETAEGPRPPQAVTAPAPRQPPLQSPPPAVSPSNSTGDIATWTIPLHITVSIGQPVRPAQPGPVSLSGQAEVDSPEIENVVVDQDYSTRPGYDPSFLDELTVPLPTITPAMEKDTAEVQEDARKNGDPFELAYYHYSVYMNKQRRTAWFSAANVDGKQRPKLDKRQGDKWYKDTRIDDSEQLTQKAFEPGIDRGHLTRREDTAWGEDVDSATQANNDTFHFTNCSLQASAFNRGKDRWQGLEQFLLEQHAKKDKRRMIVITGPLFSANDPVYKNDKMDYSVRCPLQFWKVCVLIREDGTPSATGFVLGQEEIKDLPGFEEGFDVAATQIKIVDLEDETGIRFGDLKKHDHFAEGGAPGTLELPQGTTPATRAGRIIRTGLDIVV